MKFVTVVTLELTRDEYNAVKNMNLHDEDIVIDGYKFHRYLSVDEEPGWCVTSNSFIHERDYLGDIRGLRSHNGIVSINVDPHRRTYSPR